MTSSKEILGRYITVGVQEEILLGLIEDADYDGVASIIGTVKLADGVAENVGKKMCEKLEESLLSFVSVDDDADRQEDEVKQLWKLLGVCVQLQGSRDFVIEYLSGILLAFIDSGKNHLFYRGSSADLAATRACAMERKSNIDVNKSLDGTKILEVIENLVLQMGTQDEVEHTIGSDSSIGNLLFLLSVCKEEQLANKATSLFKWWVPAFSNTCQRDSQFDNDVWGLVESTLQDSNMTSSAATVRNVFVFWLRMLLENGFSDASRAFVQKNEYWRIIQYGLGHEVHEIKKVVLSIMRLSLKLIRQESMSVDCSLLVFSGEETQMNSWKRFTTIYEIVGIDTALNQCEAAAPDILDTFQDENIHASWGLIILSTGLRATMESVRKFTLRLMLQIENKNVFQSNLSLLQTVFLPATMQASFFNVSGDRCNYADALVEFVSEIVQTSVDKEAISQLILQTLYDCRTMFDAARVFIAYGLLSGLQKNKSRILTSESVSMIKLLFMGECEESVLQTTMQCTLLKLLLYTNISAFEFLQVLVAHVKSVDTYEYATSVIGIFRDFCIVNYPQGLEVHEVPQEPLYQVFAYELFDTQPLEFSNEFLKELIKSGSNCSNLSEKYHSFLTELVDMKTVDYKDSKVVLDLEQFTPPVYSAINPLPLLQALLDQFDAAKFDFFVALFSKVMQSTSTLTLSFDQLIAIYDVIKQHVSSHNQSSFRYKDEIYANFFKLAGVCIKSTHLDDNQIEELITLIIKNVDNDNSNYAGNLEVSYLCQSILDLYVLPTLHTLSGKEERIVERILGLQCSMWDSLIEERLVLNQQPLHLAIIKGIFHHAVFLAALSDEFTFSLLLRYGNAILDQSFSRRTLKPCLSHQIVSFMELYGKSLPDRDYSDFVTLLVNIFIHESMNLNIFTLKPVIAKLYDKKLRLYVQGGLYKHIYGDDEIVTRANIVKSLLLSTKEFKQHFLMSMLENDSNILKAKKKTDGPEEIQRLLKWQLCLLSIKSVNNKTLTELCVEYIIPSLVGESSPLVRVYSEWFVAYNIWQSHEEGTENPNEETLLGLLEDSSRPAVQTSIERLLFLAVKASKESGKFTSLTEKFLAQLVTNCSSNKPLIRHFSNSLMLLFWPTFQDDIKDDTLKSVIFKLYSDAKKIQVQGQFRAGDANTWSILDDLKLTSIFGGVLLKIMDHDVPYIPSKVFNQVNIQEDEYPVGSEENQLWLSKRNNNVASKTELQKNSPLQTKSGAWEVVLDFDNEKSAENVKRSELIVIASLVDKAPNLGGICRLCDVLGVGTMTVHDIRVKQHPQFKNVAVTADNWMPIEEVPVDQIVTYMNTKKLEGYTLIGLEQTDSSIELNSEYRFPSKSVILLGTEAHGIPGHLLKELDLCLEIKQSGVIRSMNIQTATAVIVHSYSIQHL